MPHALATRTLQWKTSRTRPAGGLSSVVRTSSQIAIVALAISCAPPALVEPGPATPEVHYLRHQETLTPLPVRVRLPAAEGAEHVIVLFRTWGSRGWRSVELARAGQTWSGEVSCREVSTVTGRHEVLFRRSRQRR